MSLFSFLLFQIIVAKNIPDIVWGSRSPTAAGLRLWMFFVVRSWGWWYKIRHPTPRIHGTTVEPWIADFYGRFLGKYTSPMDPMEVILKNKHLKFWLWISKRIQIFWRTYFSIFPVMARRFIGITQIVIQYSPRWLLLCLPSTPI